MFPAANATGFLLARLFLQPAKVLVLDRTGPTIIDAETLELLEELLPKYTGTLLLVSMTASFWTTWITSNPRL